MIVMVVACLSHWALASTVIPVLRVADTINPGTANYIETNIRSAENDNARLLVIELDTPGGLLTATRQIVQTMLNSPIPIVVFVGPKGAHAGSAGALITLAADVAAMAPGTNMGAAHPVVPGGGKVDSTLNEKMINDTAAFAESIARAKGRNQAWAVKAVRKSESVISDVALKEGVIDLIAGDLDELLQKLSGFKLRTPKNGVTELPSDSLVPKSVPMTVKHRLISFFADPNLAYMILSLGGLCIWLELSHPGLIFPGVLGVICVLLSLVSFQMMPIHYGALGFILLGLGMVVAEIFLPTFGILGIGGIVSFVIGSIYLMDTGIPEFQIDSVLIFSVATILAGAALLLGYLVVSARKTRLRSGMEAFVGEYAVVKDRVTAGAGKVLIQGELWTARSASGVEIPEGSTVRVRSFEDLTLIVDVGS